MIKTRLQNSHATVPLKAGQGTSPSDGMHDVMFIVMDEAGKISGDPF